MRKRKCMNQIQNLGNRKKAIINHAFSFLFYSNFISKH